MWTKGELTEATLEDYKAIANTIKQKEEEQLAEAYESAMKLYGDRIPADDAKRVRESFGVGVTDWADL